MQVVLINPPFCDPLTPPPAVAALAESLASAADVVAFDLSLEVFNALFDSSAGTAKDSVDQPYAPTRIGKQFRTAFQNGIPAVLKMKEIERSIQHTLNASTQGLFEIGRGTLDPVRNWPASSLSLALCQFSSSVFGKALESAVDKTLPSVEGAHCVALSVTFPSQTIPALMVAQLLRRAGYKGVIALGGAQATFTHEYLVSLTPVQELIDVIYVGEFPVTSEGFVNYCAALQRVAREARSLSVIHSGQFESAAVAHVPPELTSNGSGYRYLPLGDYWGAEPLIHVSITEGCYWGKCAFCAITRVYGGATQDCEYARNAPEQAIQRMVSFQEKLGISVLSLEMVVIDPRTLVEVARGLAKQGVRLTWHAIARFENGFTRRVLEELFGGGCRRLFLGFESGSPEMLQRMGKGIQLDTVKQILHDCAEIGIGVEIGLFFGFPGEQDKDALATLDFLAEHSSLIHRCDVGNSAAIGTFACLRSSLAGTHPEKYGIEIGEPIGNWDNLTWRDPTGITLKDPQYYSDRVMAIQPERFLLDVSEDVWLVCKYGVRAVDEQLRQHMVSRVANR